MTNKASGIDRRKVLQGALWTAPVVVVATAAPASAAASPEEGAIFLTGVNANATDVALTVNAVVGFLANGGSAGTLPVNGIVVSVVLPTSTVTSATPVSGSALWDFKDSQVEGTNTVYRFTWTGDDLTASYSATLNMPIRFTRTSSSVTPIAITVRADGFSNSNPVPQVSQPITSTWGATLVFDNPSPIQRFDIYSSYGPAYVFYAQPRWAGPYNPQSGQAVGNIETVASIPVANAADPPEIFVEAAGADWTLVSGPAVVGDLVRVVFRSSTVISSSPDRTSTLQFGIKAKPSPPAKVAHIRLQGETTGGNSTVFVDYYGPAS